MEYNVFGSTESMASRFGMGCMRLPRMKTDDGSYIIDENESIKMIRYAVDNGVNYFDTAYSYPGSEVLLGKALSGGYREKVMISTKCPIWEVNSYYDYQRLFNEELDRLQTNYIDVYIFHNVHRDMWERIKATDGLRFMEQLKADGRIRQFGFSCHGEFDFFKELVDAYAWDTCTIQLNILDQNHQAGVKGLKYAAEKGISVVIMEPLKGGDLLGNPPEEVYRLIEEYHEKRSLVEWAFRWIYNQKEARVILSGASSMEQLKDNIRIFKESKPAVMSEQDIELINKIKEIYDSKVKVGCTGCGYCMPCPQRVNIPDIFKVYNDVAMSPWTEYGRTFYSLVATSTGRDASNCIECGVCEGKCPQGISIISHLKDAHELMKAQ